MPMGVLSPPEPWATKLPRYCPVAASYLRTEWLVSVVMNTKESRNSMTRGRAMVANWPMVAPVAAS